MCCDTETPDLYQERRPRSRRDRRCCACTESIRINDRYVRISGKWDGRFMAFTQCLRCNEMLQCLSSLIGEPVDITLGCDADPLQPGEAPTLEYLAFVTRDEMQGTL